MSARKAQRTPKDLDGSGWYDILPPQPPTPALECSVSTDWLVIGAGFAGCHAVRRLLEHDPTADVVLLEAQDIGFGACGRNSGFMIDLPHELQSDDYAAGAEGHSEIALNRRAIGFATRCADDFDLHDSFELCGKYHGAADLAGMRSLDAFCQGLDAVDEPYTRLNADDMKEVTGTSFYRSGIHTPGCAILQPAGYIRGLVRGMANRHPSLSVYAHSPAQHIIPGSNGQPHRVVTPNGTIETRRLILTVNGHLESFGWFTRRLMHVFTFASMTEPLSQQRRSMLGGLPSWGLVSAHPMGSTVRRTRDHRIVVRNTFTYNPSMATSPEQVAALGRRHDRSYVQRFGHLGDVRMAHRWGGHLCLARNSGSVFGELEKNIFAACCHNGLGTSKGTLGGLCIADLAAGIENGDTDTLLNAAPPVRLPPSALMTPAARAYLAWSHWRAGKEL